MKKIFALVISATFLVVPVDAFGAIKSGTACKPLNTSKISGGLKYTCVKSKGKLVWNKGVAVGTQSPTPSPDPVATESPISSASPSPSESPVVLSDVTAGAFCSPAGAIGKTKTGLSVTCKTSATDTRNRWRQ